MEEAPTTPLRTVIFDPASCSNKVTHTFGSVVLVDLAIDRMDIAHDGAKLALQLDGLDEASRRVVTELSAFIAEKPQVVVTGAVRKQQRRTFMEATCVRVVPGSAS